MPSMTTQSDILTRFGRRVRALRTARGQSQETFAERSCPLSLRIIRQPENRVR
jgi:hypothetical protein